jgi:heparin/heparan-sulfate lyase
MTRSSWQKEATFGFFQCGDERAGHQHRDNNAFTIHKFAPLAIDSGVYEGNTPHYGNYFKRSIAHNTITVYDPDEKFWTGETNDGGQNVFGRSEAVGNAHPDRFGEVTTGSNWDVGDIVAYEANPYFTYAVGDASRSYGRQKVVEFKRAFLHVQADRFVIYDRVTTTKPDFPVRWLLHSIDEPEVTGDLVTLTNGPGRLFSRTLWPKEPRIETIGGVGRDFWVNGKNYPPEGRDGEQGSWRVEVTQDGGTRYEFLHALCAASSAVTEMDHMKVGLQENTFTVGFVESGRWVEVAFSREWSPGDPVGGRITVRAAGTGSVIIDRELTQEVIPEAGYVRWAEQ